MAVRRTRDMAAEFTALVRDCGPRVLAVVRRLVHDPSDAEDSVQEAFLNAYRRWDDFRGEAARCTWLHSIAIRAATRRARREARRRGVAREYAQAIPFMHPRLARADFAARSAEARELRDDARARVGEALREVAEPFRTALLLKEIAGMSIGDVARVLGVKEATVKTRLHRGRILLRAALLAERPPRAVPPAAYDRATCMDLLRAKMDALDRGAEFPVQDALACERCREVFASLDVGADACRSLRAATMPAALRRRIEAVIRAEGPLAPRRG